MAGYDDTRQMIISTLMGRPNGEEIQPENQQAYELNMLDYIRSLELIANGPLIGIATPTTQPVQPNDARACYLAGVAQDRTVTFQNFRNYLGQPIQITNGQMEACLVILIWDTQYWSAETVPTSIISQADQANFFYDLSIKKTYNGISEMNADSNNPIGDNGKYIEIGDLVSVIEGDETFIYSRITNGWRYQAKLNGMLGQYTLLGQWFNGSSSDLDFDIRKNLIGYNVTSVDFIQGQYLSNTEVNIGDVVTLKYPAAADARTIRIPVKAGTFINVYTKQGAFPPCLLVDKNMTVLEKFGEKAKNYLINPLNVIPSFDGFLIVNAHELLSEDFEKLKVSGGILNSIRNDSIKYYFLKSQYLVANRKEFKVSKIRLNDQFGNLIESDENFSFDCNGFTTIIADLNSNPGKVLLKKSDLNYPWNYNNETNGEFIFASQSDGIWKSDIASVQSQIDKQNKIRKLFFDKNGSVSYDRQTNIFTITGLSFNIGDGENVSKMNDSYSVVLKNGEFIYADCWNDPNSIILGKNNFNFYEENTFNLIDIFIIAYVNEDGTFGSDIPVISSKFAEINSIDFSENESFSLTKNLSYSKLFSYSLFSNSNSFWINAEKNRTYPVAIKEAWIKPVNNSVKIFKINLKNKQLTELLTVNNLCEKTVQKISLGTILLDTYERLSVRVSDVFYKLEGKAENLELYNGNIQKTVVSTAFIPLYNPIDSLSSYVGYNVTSVDFIQGQYLSNTEVNIGDVVTLKYPAAADARTIRIPVKAGTFINVYTKQGAFPPCLLVDDTDTVLEKFGEKAKNYLINPLNVIPSFDGFLIVNAHELLSEDFEKLKVSLGIIGVLLNMNKTDHEKEIYTTNIVVKKNGTIGVDCDFNDPKIALNSINDASFYNRYCVMILDGDYDYSNTSDDIGLRMKNFVTIKGQSYKTRIIKRDSVFSWNKATIDKDNGDLDWCELIGPMTVISNNCKCPIHIDSGSVKYGYFANLNLINEQILGTGDNPSDGEANCFALGWRKSDHIILQNITANGKLWGHNNTDTNSKAKFEFLNCNARRIQIGDLTSQGQDEIIVRGCKIDVFELLWFSEFTSINKFIRPSYSFDFSGNNIGRSIIADHAGNKDALSEYYNGKYPFNIGEIQKEFYGEGIQIGDFVTLVNESEVKKWTMGENFYGLALENSDENNRLLIQYSGDVVMKASGTTPIQTGDELNISNSSGILSKRTSGTLVGYSKSSLNSVEGDILVKIINK